MNVIAYGSENRFFSHLAIVAMDWLRSKRTKTSQFITMGAQGGPD